MSVAEDWTATAEIGGQLQHFCSRGCWTQYPAERSQKAEREAGERADRLLDPVCNMEVNAGWDITRVHSGTTFYFCTERCREVFASDPEAYLGYSYVVVPEKPSARRRQRSGEGAGTLRPRLTDRYCGTSYISTYGLLDCGWGNSRSRDIPAADNRSKISSSSSVVTGGEKP